MVELRRLSVTGKYLHLAFGVADHFILTYVYMCYIAGSTRMIIRSLQLRLEVWFTGYLLLNQSTSISIPRGSKEEGWEMNVIYTISVDGPGMDYGSSSRAWGVNFGADVDRAVADHDQKPFEVMREFRMEWKFSLLPVGII